MRMPDVDRAVVEERKITQYLLNAAHPDNGGKAGFFNSLGFTVAGWPVLAEALRAHARDAEVLRCVESQHGCKYVLDGPIETPDRIMATIRSIWIVDLTKQVPRLVTAYPKA